MKTTTRLRLLVSMTCVAAWHAGAQPKLAIPTEPPPSSNYIMVLVTNWVDAAPGLRTVNDQVYNPEISELWKSVTIPAGAAIQGASYSGSIQPIDVTFVWGPHEGREHQTVTVNNYPYNPRDFVHERHNAYSDIIAARELHLRVFPLDIQTNYSALGRMWVGQRTYDYGLPYTGKIAVTSWEQVPADERHRSRKKREAASDYPPATPINIYTQGPLHDRLEAIQRLPAGEQRDDYLMDLAKDAAGRSDVPLLKETLESITNHTRHDQAAKLASVTLLKNGKAGDAYAIAGTILDAHMHKKAIIELDRLNQ